MPLPNSGSGQNQGSNRFTAAEAFTPDTAAQSRMDISSADVRKLQNQNQTITKLLDTVSSRLSNITNIRSNVQSATFDAFGNNFISRGMNQLVNTLTDTIGSIISPPEEEAKDDPTTVAIKKQTELLTQIEGNQQSQITQTTELLTTSNQTRQNILTYIRDSKADSALLIGYTKDSLALQTKQSEYSNEIVIQTDSTVRAVDALRNVSSGQSTKLDDVITELKRITAAVTSSGSVQQSHRGVARHTAIPTHQSMSFKKRKEVTPPETTYIIPPHDIADAKTGFQPTGEKQADIPQPETAPGTEEQKEKKKSSRAQLGEQTFAIFQNMDKTLESSRVILTNILDVQKECCANIAKMSTSAIDAKEEQIANEAKAAEVNARESAKQSTKPEIVPLERKTGVGRGFKDFFKSFVPFGKKEQTAVDENPPETIQSESSSIVGDVAGAAAAGVAGSKLSTIGKKIKGFGAKGIRTLSGAKSLILPAAIMQGAVAGVDSIAGDLGVGKDTIDTKQDDENWNKMSFGEKLQSGTARGIEKVGSFFFMDNLAKQAQADRIRKETEYLNPGKAAAQNLDTIEHNSKELQKSVTTEKSEKPTANVVNNNVVNNTMMSSRAVVKNTDDSYNRYISSTMGRFA